MANMRVLVSGAGVAGPTVAWFLARAGAHVTVLEKSESTLRQGQNIDINHSAIKVLEKMDLIGELRKWNTTEKGTQFIAPNGKPYAPFPAAPTTSAFDLTSEFEILRGDLATILYEASKTLPNVNYVFGTTIKEVLSNDENSVRVELSTGEVQEYDLLVAADGQWSRVRKQCFPAESVQTIDKGLYIGYFTAPRLANDNDWWNVYFSTESRSMSTRPDPHGTIRAMLSRMPCTAAQKKAFAQAARADSKTQKELLRSEFADAGWQAQRLLNAMDTSPDFYFQAIQLIKMSKWSTSRVVCLGDAAHAPTPLTGMGSTLAIIGAYVLAGELSTLEGGENPARALEEYEAKLRPFVEEIQQIPSFVPGVAHPDAAWKRWLLSCCLALGSKVASIPWLAAQFDKKEDRGFPLPHYACFDREDFK